MRIIFALTLVVAVWACNSGREIPTQEETQAWFVGVMTEVGTIARRCIHDDAWHSRTPTEEETRQMLADLEVIQRMGQAAADQGVELLTDPYGQYLMTFQEEMSEDAWHSIWPHVEAYKVVAERQVAELEAEAALVGCLEIRSPGEVEEWFAKWSAEYQDMAAGCSEEQIAEALIDESGALNPTAKYDLARLRMAAAAEEAGLLTSGRGPYGEASLGFRPLYSHVDYELWRGIAPEVEAFIKAVEDLTAFAWERFAKVGCL